MLTGETGLPVVYHENILYLMTQEPEVVFAYWDLSFGLIQALSTQKETILYLYKESNQYRKVILPPFTNNWYFRNVEPGHFYYCELGFQGDDGTFFPLLRSNQVDTPRKTPFEEEKWETVQVAVSETGNRLSGRGSDEDQKTEEVLFSSTVFYNNLDN